uniref:Uncharacterized protein n=1 Tax=Rhizophora mucronata TaxID=61149 RepID=A0A2P2N6D6_RHIMU
MLKYTKKCRSHLILLLKLNEGNNFRFLFPPSVIFRLNLQSIFLLIVLYLFYTDQ